MSLDVRVGAEETAERPKGRSDGNLVLTPDVLSRFIIENRSDLVALAANFVPSQFEAEDAVQEACVQAIRHLNEIRSLPHWMRVVVKNRAKYYSQFATKLRGKRFEPFFDVADPLNEDPLEKQEVQKNVQSALRKISAKEQEAVDDFYDSDLSLQAIADLRQEPLGTIKRRLFTARHRLSKFLTPDGELRPSTDNPQ